MLDLGDLLEKIPNLISQLTQFSVFSVYLLDKERQELAIAYAVGYPEEIVKHFTIKVGQGTVGRAVEEQRTIVIDDVGTDPHYLAVVPGAKSQLSVPLRNKGEVIGALNLLSDKLGAFSERDEWILRQFGAHVAQAIATARLFESEREYTETLETLAEIGREMSAILDPNELLTRLAQLIKRVVDYRISASHWSTTKRRCSSSRSPSSSATIRGRSSRSKWARAWSATPRCTRKWCWCPMSPRIRATSMRSQAFARSWWFHCC